MARWFLSALGLAFLVAALVLVFSRSGPKTSARSIVILGTWFSNNQQVVSFRLAPSNSEAIFADIVPVSEVGSNQPPVTRVASQYLAGFLLPASYLEPGGETNPEFHYLALPRRRASIEGKPVTYTPGSYTVAYTPSASANRIRVGVALERRGLDDCLHRLRNWWQQKKFVFLGVKTYGDPLYVTSEPITNGARTPANQNL
jgi:hypothetical protein